MKNFYRQFRRRRLDEPDGCADFNAPPFLLVCHKGDAQQQQSSTQTGAQSGGVAINGGRTGGGAINTTGNQVIINASVSQPAYGGARRGGGSSGGLAVGDGSAAGSVITTINNGISGDDVSAAINSLADALKPVPVTAPATPATTAAPGSVQDFVSSLTWQSIAGIAAVLGFGFYFLFGRKKT